MPQNSISHCDARLVRSEVIRLVREFFHARQFVETDTPSFVLSPGMEPHIRPVQVERSGVFLPTSPEFAMKKILAHGYSKIFQICKAYRYEPKSSTHNPEFTILEWYRAKSGFEEIMDDVEALFEFICQGLFKSTGFETKEYGVQNLARPWKRLTIEECFKKFAQLEISELQTSSAIADACIGLGLLAKTERDSALWDDCFFRIMMNVVEPALKKLKRPVIIYNYPPSQAALSNLFTDDRGLTWAKRFEVYAGGIELANAFDELTNAEEQRARFTKDMALRKKLYGTSMPISPIDEDFLNALKKMPATGGIALGVDRLAMYFSGADQIQDVLWGASHWPE